MEPDLANRARCLRLDLQHARGHEQARDQLQSALAQGIVAADKREITQIQADYHNRSAAHVWQQAQVEAVALARLVGRPHLAHRPWRLLDAVACVLAGGNPDCWTTPAERPALAVLLWGKRKTGAKAAATG